MNNWLPDCASQPLEEDMERKDIPEDDKDEVRRFAEVLRRKKQRKDLDAAGGGPLMEAPEGMREWLEGKT